MHVIALKSGLVVKYPWIAMNLMQAFDEAKNMSLARIKDLTASSVPLPWVTNMASLSESILGGDIWPYGIEGNRPTLKAFLQYAYEQGVCHRQLEIEELFVPSTLSKVKV